MKSFTPTCFFCDKDERDMKLDLCQTFQVQRKIEEIAQEIGDTKVLAKLSVGDMKAIEAKYHCKCLAAYYSKKRNEQPTSAMQQENEITAGDAKYQCYNKAIYLADFF